MLSNKYRGLEVQSIALSGNTLALVVPALPSCVLKTDG